MLPLVDDVKYKDVSNPLTAGVVQKPPGVGVKPNYADDSQAGLNSRLAAMQAANGGAQATTAQFNNAEQNAALSQATTGQNPLTAGAPARAWYAGTPSTETRSGLELERERRAAAGPLTRGDPVKAIALHGVMIAPQISSGQSSSASPELRRLTPSEIESAKAAHQGIMDLSPSSKPVLGSSSMAAGEMSADQRSKAADAYATAVDKATGVSSAGAQGIAGLTKRFDTYANNPDVLAMRNVREQLLGSGIQFDKGANGKLTISNSGGQAIGDMLPAARGSSINMQEGNAVIARANQARGEMIDSMTKAGGGNGIAILGGDGPTEAEKINAERTQRWMLDDLSKDKSRAGKAAYGNAIGQIIAGQNGMAQENLRQQGIAGGHAVQRRGQDMTAGSEANRLIADAPLRDEKLLGMQQQNRSAGITAGLQERAIAGDAKAMETLRQLNGKSDPRFTTHVVGGGSDEMGKALPQKLAVTGPDGTPRFYDGNGQSGGQQSAPAQDKREVGKTYQTPKGPMVWRGNGWEAAR